MTSNLTKLILDARNKDQDNSVRPSKKRITKLKKVRDRKSMEKSLRPSVDVENVLGPAAVIKPPKTVMKKSQIGNKVVKKSKKTRSDETKPPKTAAAAVATPRRKRIVSIKAAVEAAKIRNSDEGQTEKNTNGEIGISSALNNGEKIHEKKAVLASMSKATRKHTALTKAVVEPSTVWNVTTDNRYGVPHYEGKVQVTKTVGESSLDTRRKGHWVVKRKKAVRKATKDMNLVGDVKKTTTKTLKLAPPKSISKHIVKTEKPLRADVAVAAVVASVVTVNPLSTAAAVKKSVFLSKL